MGLDWPTIQIAIVLALVVVVFFGFIRETIPADIVAVCAIAVLVITGVLGTEEAFTVFSNGAPITIGCMFILSAALERTGVIDAMGRIFTRAAKGSPFGGLVVLMLVVITASAFVNNTPVVVILTPVVIALAHKLNLAPSRLLIPLSYASILGGMTTLIGTSTNILVDSVARNLGLASFGMFEMTGPGLVLAAVGTLYLLICARWLLPNRKMLTTILPDPSKRHFLTEFLIPHDSPLIGKTLQQAGFKSTPGTRVIDLLRKRMSLRRQLADTVLEPGDRLVLRTTAADVMSMRQESSVAFEMDEGHTVEPVTSETTTIMEGIVGPQSRFVGQHVADLNLRRLYGVYILAVHRRNENLRRNFDEVRLSFGDTLLLEGPPEGLRNLFDGQELVNLSEPAEHPFRKDKAPIAILAIFFVVGMALFNVLPIAALALIAAVGVVLLGCLDADEAYSAIRWRIMMLIFGMLAVGMALEKTGAASLIVTQLAGLVVGLGPVAVLSVVYFMTSLLTEVMSNNATAILMTPIAVGLAMELGLDPRPFAIAVMFGASATFATPIGYQTNTFVYNAGGYRFIDFVKVGLPLNLLLWAVATLVIPLFWEL